MFKLVFIHPLPHHQKNIHASGAILLFLRYELTPFPLFPAQYGPMRHTDALLREGHLLIDSLNILSVKITSSDVGYPVSVYGAVLIRDCLDMKCNYIFRRDRDNCQHITSPVCGRVNGFKSHVFLPLLHMQIISSSVMSIEIFLLSGTSLLYAMLLFCIC